MEERDYRLKIKNLWNPTIDEIIELAYSRELIGMQDWQFAIIYPIDNIIKIIPLANDKNCPKRIFFLSCLYTFVGDFVNGIYNDELKKFKNILSYAKEFDSQEVKDWVIRAEELFNNPEKYDRKYWGLSLQYVIGEYIKKKAAYKCNYNGGKFIFLYLNNKMGLMNKQGEIIIDFEYDCIEEFVEDVAMVIKDNKYGFINSIGTVVIPLKFDNVRDFKDGIAYVKLGDKDIFINKSGEIVEEPIVDGKITWIEISNDGCVIKIKDKEYKFVDKIVKFVTNPVYGEIYTLEKGMATFFICYEEEPSSRWGIIDEKGNYIVEPQFDFIGVFVDDIAEVEKDEKWGYLNREGKVITHIIFDETRPFCDGLARIKVGNQWGFINKLGKVVIEPQFGEIYIDDFCNSK